jgi:hypothetical protein
MILLLHLFSYRRLVEGAQKGGADPATLAELARGSLRGKIPILRKALEGRFTAHHALLVSQMLGHIDYLEEAISELSRALDGHLQPF